MVKTDSRKNKAYENKVHENIIYENKNHENKNHENKNHENNIQQSGTGKNNSRRSRSGIAAASGAGSSEAAAVREYLSVREVAELSGFSYGTVRRAIDAGTLAAYRIGRKFFIERQAAMDYCCRHTDRRNVEGYTIRELMERLSLSYAFLSGLIKSGELKSVRVGRQYIVTEESFREFMSERRL